MKSVYQRAALPVAGAAAAVAALALATAAFLAPSPMLLAPMMGLDPCLMPSPANTVDGAMARSLEPACSGPEGSAAQLLEATLAGLETPGTWRQPYELGYTLNVPLLRLFKRAGTDWAIDQELVDRLARTIRDNDRPVVVYLFSTHFSQDAPIEQALAADPANLGWTQDGPLAPGVYYGAPIYNWTFASTRNGITQRRVQAGRAMLEAVCRLGPWQVRKVRGITLLGELHHLFPDFEQGMGFDKPYLVTDYSETSKAGFRSFLRGTFITPQRMNAALGSDWPSFEAVEPPGKDVRSMPLKDYTEHIDSYAHGSIPISGWAYVPETDRPAGWTPRVRVYRNGVLAGNAPIVQHRQDVLAALPELGTADTGWRWDFDFRAVPPGLHQIDLLLEAAPGDLVLLASRRIAVMDKRHATPEPQPQAALPPHRKADASTRFNVDVPRDLSSYFHNPMVPLWHEFRGRQVAKYLHDFRVAMQVPCLADTQRYTHQIIPFTNPGWDETKFAIDPSLRPLPGLALGVSLYGEPTYGSSFLRWVEGSGHRAYGVTEFHPLKALSPEQMRDLLERHARQGGTFLSFFMEPRWQGRKASLHTNLFSIDPQNPQFGSDRLYASMREVLANDVPPRRLPAARPAGPAGPATPAAAGSTP